MEDAKPTSQRSTRAQRRNSGSLSSNRETSVSPGSQLSTGSSTKPPPATEQQEPETNGSPKTAEKLAATRQSRRIKNGTKKRKSEVRDLLVCIGDAHNQHSPQPDETAWPPPQEEDGDIYEFDEDLERCVYDLASLDAHSCARGHMSDANRILQRFLIPMSLPWTYPILARPSVSAYDIDDFPGNLVEDGASAGRDPTAIRDAMILATPQVRRSKDKGVIELLEPVDFNDTVNVHPQDMDLGVSRPNGDQRGPVVPGELALQLYEQMQSTSKRQKVDQAEAQIGVKTTSVSIKFGTVSSRSTLFQDISKEKSCPLFVLAIFPRVVQDGQRRRGLEAVAAAKMFGSYNCRAIPPGAIPKSSKEAGERIWLGRNRLMWSEKDPPRKGTNRSPYRSILSNEKIELARLKRPMSVKVAIRIEGELVSHTATDVREHAYVVDSALRVSRGPDWYDTAKSMVYKDALLDDALGMNTEQESPITDPVEEVVPNVSQYRLRADVLFKNICKTPILGTPLEKIRKPFEITPPGSNGESKTSLVIEPPWIDCLVVEEGLLNVVCSRPGKIIMKSPGNESLGYGSIAMQHHRCPVCWQPAGDIDFSPAIRCSLCSVETHTFCAGVKEDETNWTCSDCINNSKDVPSERLCVFCYAPGAVRPMGDHFVHDACRVWCEAELDDDGDQQCSLCSGKTDRLVSCMADRCNVRFHPRCALVSSACVQLQEPKEEEEDDDAYLCMQSTLTMMEVVSERTRRRTKTTTTLPVAFCGYHNPRRAEMMRGLYPNAQVIDTAIRVPPSRESPPTSQESS